MYYVAVMNKHHAIDTTQPVTFEVSTAELPNFSVVGSYEDVLPLYTELSRSLPKRSADRSIPRGAKPAIKAPVSAASASRLTLDFKARVYDLQNGTHFFEALRTKRQLEKDLRMAQALGLLTDDVCAKHRKALTAVKAVR